MLTHLELRNFKTFEDASIPIAPMTLVLGSNGAGKSNLFDALRFLKAVGEGTSVRDAIEGHASPTLASPTVPGIRGGAAAVPRFGSGSREFEICARFEVQNDTIDYLVCVDCNTYRVVKEQLQSQLHPGPYVFSTHPETAPLEQHRESPAIVVRFYKATSGPNPKRDFSPYNFVLSQFRERRAESLLNEAVADVVREELVSIQPMELRPEVLRQYSTVGHSELGEHGEDFAAVVNQLVSAADNDRRNREVLTRQMGTLEKTLESLRAADGEGETSPIRPIRRNIEQLEEQIASYDTRLRTLTTAPEGISETEERVATIKAWLSELTPRAIEDLHVVRAPTGEMIVAVHEGDHDEEITARSLSDGTLRFAALAVAVLGVGGRQTLVIEEVENGINPARLSVLIRMLEQAVDSSTSLQIITSTHSPGILDFASERTAKDAIVIGWNNEEMRSHPVRLGDLTGLEEIREDTTLGGLQAEGWIQLAASE